MNSAHVLGLLGDASGSALKRGVACLCVLDMHVPMIDPVCLGSAIWPGRPVDGDLIYLRWMSRHVRPLDKGQGRADMVRP